MTKILSSETNPAGVRTEDILAQVRADLLVRMVAYGGDPRRETKIILDNDVLILGLLSEAIRLAEENTRILSGD